MLTSEQAVYCGSSYVARRNTGSVMAKQNGVAPYPIDCPSKTDQLSLKHAAGSVTGKRIP